ncbi:MAG: serine hydrolase domain-containing protein [Caldilineaceae bacterium]
MFLLMHSHLDPVLERIDQLLHDLSLQEELPSISAGIVFQQTVLWSQSYGYANLAEKRVADLQTIYGIGSITKVFTAIMLLQLRDAGQLQLDDPVARYLPELLRLPIEIPLTFRQLASHTAGLPTMPPLPELTQVMQEFPPTIETLRQITFPTNQRLLELLPTVELRCLPGAQVEYSNLGIALLAQALERIADQTYVDYIAERILQPLHMLHSGFTQDELPAAHLATSYLPLDSPPVAAPPAMKALKGFTAAGGLNASTRDMIHFLNFLMDDQTTLSNPILSQQSLQEMMHPVAHLSASRYTGKQVPSGVGIGWFLSTCNGHLMLEHGGADPSTAAYLAYIPDMALGIFMATNIGSNPTALARMAYTVLEQLIPQLEG